jgi:ABC-type phosphate transport system substrate-binding protein
LRPRRIVLALAAALLCAPVLPASEGYRVIVHPEVKGAQIPRASLSSIFLKKAPRWGDGRPVLPVDQSVRSPVRTAFSNDVLQQGIAEVQVYWQRRMSAGVTPPPVKASDQDVVLFVASTPGAIGYVSAATPLPDSVKTIEISD